MLGFIDQLQFWQMMKKKHFEGMESINKSLESKKKKKIKTGKNNKECNFHW